MRKLFVILMMLVPMVSWAKEFAQIDGIYYNLDVVNKVAEVTNFGDNSYSGSISIPEKVWCNATFFPVTSIGDEAFSYCSGLTSVTIPNSVTSIGRFAFNNCHVLTSVTIPNSVTSIGKYAFNRCYGLTSVSIPNSVTSIGEQTFSGCTGLTSISIPNSVTSIGSQAFSGCI